MKNQVNEVISIITASPLVALYTILILLANGLISIEETAILVTILTILPLAIPLYFSIRYGIEWDYPKRRDRVRPLALVTMAYIVGFMISHFTGASYRVKLLILVYVFVALTLLAITLFYKISIHIAGIISPAIYLLKIDLWLFALIYVIVSIIAGYSRIKLCRHTLDQIIASYLITCIITFIVLEIY